VTSPDREQQIVAVLGRHGFERERVSGGSRLCVAEPSAPVIWQDLAADVDHAQLDPAVVDQDQRAGRPPGSSR
jgi:hypothetical protein